MLDKAGQVYLAVGGLLAGAGAGAFLSGATTAFVGWSWAAGTGCAAVTAVGTYMLLASLLGWPLPGRRSTLVHVISTAQELSAEILAWIADRDIRNPDYGYSPPAQTHEDWALQVDRSSRYGTDTMNKWREKFAVRAIASYDQLLAHGANEPERARFSVEYPVNSVGVKDAGQALGMMAADLAARKTVR